MILGMEGSFFYTYFHFCQTGKDGQRGVLHLDYSLFKPSVFWSDSPSKAWKHCVKPMLPGFFRRVTYSANFFIYMTFFSTKRELLFTAAPF